MSIRLIVGLGNPGPRYARTRHNIGAAWLAELAERFDVPLKPERKFAGLLGRGELFGHDVRLLLPTTYVNLSGNAVGSVARFHKMAAEELLVAYDEVDFPVGVSRLKTGGGHNGHNGLKSVMASLGGERGFARLRIGIDRPDSAEDMVAYLTTVAMPKRQQAEALTAARLSDAAWRLVLAGDWQNAMNLLHAPAA